MDKRTKHCTYGNEKAEVRSGTARQGYHGYVRNSLNYQSLICQSLACQKQQDGREAQLSPRHSKSTTIRIVKDFLVLCLVWTDVQRLAKRQAF